MSTTLLAQQKQKVTISGTIENFSKKDIALEILAQPLASKPMSLKGQLDENGQFSIAFETFFPLPVTLVYNRQKLRLFTEPGDNLAIVADAKKIDKTVSFTNKGASNNAFLFDFFSRFRGDFQKLNNRNTIKKLVPLEYKNFADSLCTLQNNFVDTYKAKEKPSDQTLAYTKALINYTWAAALLTQPKQHVRYNAIKSKFEIPSEYYSFLNEVNLNNDAALTMEEYHKCVNGFVDHLTANTIADQNNYDWGNYYAAKVTTAKKYLKGRTLYFVVAKGIIDGFSRGKVETVMDHYQWFKANNPHADFGQTVDKLYTQYKHLAAGSIAPGFTLRDIDGKEVSLDDFKGKVVYLDFWASWCGPCRKEIPHAKKLKEAFKGKDVAFLYVSTDKTEAPWRAIIEKEEMKGVQLIAGSQAGTISQQYAISGIPKFVLIDQEGNIADSYAKRPSHRGIAGDLDRLLAGESLQQTVPSEEGKK